MSGEFPAASVEEVIAMIARFFGEKPPQVEAEGFAYAVGATLAAGASPAA